MRGYLQVMQTKRVRATPSQMGASQTALRWDEAPQGGVLRRVRVVRRGVLVLLFTLAACGVQALCLLVPGRARVVFARLYWASVCRLIGLRVRVVGTQVRRGSGGAGPGGRSVVFASNHSSWLDVLVLGGTLEACFVSKAEVDTWPVVKTVARLGRDGVREPPGAGGGGRAGRDAEPAGGWGQPSAVPGGHEQ